MSGTTACSSYKYLSLVGIEPATFDAEANSFVTVKRDIKIELFLLFGDISCGLCHHRCAHEFNYFTSLVNQLGAY